MLENSNKELSPVYKWLLYKMYILLIALYRFQLQYFKEAPLYQPLKELVKMQRKVALWITKAFWTSFTWKVEVTARFMPIYFYLDKINDCHHLCVVLLPKQHVINFLLDKYHSKKTVSYYIAIAHLIPKQHKKELSPRFYLVDTFSNCFLFLLVN